MLAVRVEFLGDVVIERRLLNVAENAADLSNTWVQILDQFTTWTGEQFASDGRFFGESWPPLTDGTIAQKRAEGVSSPEDPLRRTGALFASTRGGPDHVREVSNDEAAWGTRDPKAMFHHGRRRSASNRVPRRAIFELDEARRRWVLRQIHEGVFSDA